MKTSVLKLGAMGIFLICSFVLFSGCGTVATNSTQESEERVSQSLAMEEIGTELQTEIEETEEELVRVDVNELQPKKKFDKPIKLQAEHAFFYDYPTSKNFNVCGYADTTMIYDVYEVYEDIYKQCDFYKVILEDGSVRFLETKNGTELEVLFQVRIIEDNAVVVQYPSSFEFGEWYSSKAGDIYDVYEIKEVEELDLTVNTWYRTNLADGRVAFIWVEHAEIIE